MNISDIGPLFVADESQNHSPTKGVIEIHDSFGRTATVYGERKDAREVAEAICIAANSHADLVAIVERLEELSGEAVAMLNDRLGLDEPSDVTTPLEVARDDAREVLAKAGGVESAPKCPACGGPVHLDPDDCKLATDDEIDAARDEYQDGETIQIDDGAEVSRTDDGAWVAAWVYVAMSDDEGEDESNG